MRYILIFIVLSLTAPAHAATFKNCLDIKGMQGEDFDACVIDLVQRKGDVALCGRVEKPLSASQCIGTVLKDRKITEAQCNALENYKDICLARIAGKKYTLTMKDCDAMDHGYEDYDYCLWDLAEQNKDVTICGMFTTRSSVGECVESVAKLTQITAVQCGSMQNHNDVCFEKLGINKKENTESQKVIVASDKGNRPFDPVMIKDVRMISRDTLRVEVDYPGRCKLHKFDLIVINQPKGSNPAELTVYLSHDANQEFCKDNFTEVLLFDLSPIRNIRTSGVVNLTFPDGRQVMYRYMPIETTGSRGR